MTAACVSLCLDPQAHDRAVDLCTGRARRVNLSRYEPVPLVDGSTEPDHLSVYPEVGSGTGSVRLASRGKRGIELTLDEARDLTTALARAIADVTEALR